MKTTITSKSKNLLTIFACIFSLHAYSQLTPGSINAGFGVDADSKPGYLKKGTVTGVVVSDDWWPSGTAGGNSILDTTGASVYKTQLQNKSNVTFERRMRVPVNSVIGGNMWLDAAYSRDYTRQPFTVIDPLSYDSSAFMGANVNGDDPANWVGGISTTLPDKNDILDVYAHIRRAGVTIDDPLWFFAGLSTSGVSGDRHLDIELYKSELLFNKSTGRFSTGGLQMGHTAWIFDASGEVIQSGDVIITLSYLSSGVVTIAARVWVAKTTYDNVVPALFDFGTSFNGATATAAYGYANIRSKDGGFAFGSAVGNTSATTIGDTTFSTPWGSKAIAGTHQYRTEYQSGQFFELALNLTSMGIDPASYITLGNEKCETVFKSVFFKARSANAFTASLQDFAGPISIAGAPAMNYTVAGATLSCNQPTANLSVAPNSSTASFNWRTTNGTITSANSDNTQVGISKAGTYILEASVAKGCPASRIDTLVVPADSIAPVASAMVGANAMGQPQLRGSDATPAGAPAPYGPSHGLSWNWTGPNAFSSTIQNPLINAEDTGTYNLAVTELRNGCATTTSVHYNFFSMLPTNHLIAQATVSAHNVIVRWDNKEAKDISYFEIEKQKDNATFIKIASVDAIQSSTTGTWSFTDREGAAGSIRYRIKAVTKSGAVYYSNIAGVQVSGQSKEMYISKNYSGNKLFLIANVDGNKSGKIFIHDFNGNLVSTQQVNLVKGQNTIEIRNSNMATRNVQVVAVYLDNQITLVEKIIKL